MANFILFKIWNWKFIILQLNPHFKDVKHEIELGVIIGKRCKNVSEKEAMDYVGGYCLGLDMTAACYLVIIYLGD